jgi:chromosome segregation ATPase
MTIKDFWSKTKSKTSSWLQSHKPSKLRDYQPEVDDEGLISQEAESPEGGEDKSGDGQAESDKVVVKAIQPKRKQESLEKLQEGFNQLIEQLKGINEHLNRQVDQHEDLMSRLEQLPKLLESFPAVAENQKETVDELLSQLKAAATKEQQFIDAVEKIPTETGKQTDALVNIDHQLAAAADTDVQMTESVNKFNETLDKLNQSTLGQRDSILQMSKTFATSDRYLKYLISKQNRRFMWIFMTAIGVCVAAILILTGIIIYLKH